MKMYLRHSINKSLWIALSVFSIVACIEFIAIWVMNSGRFIFTLDDAYIHLALAENITNGHYGVNEGEFSAPSSSILWPFIIAPFARFSLGVYAVLAINTAAAIGTIILFWKVLLPAGTNGSEDKESSEITSTLTAILVISIPTINLLGLVFTLTQGYWFMLSNTNLFYTVILSTKFLYRF